jgi:hypothetical protein
VLCGFVSCVGNERYAVNGDNSTSFCAEDQNNEVKFAK